MREKFLSSCQHLNWNSPKGTCQSSVFTPPGMCPKTPWLGIQKEKRLLEDSPEVSVPFAFCIKQNWLRVREKVQVFYGSRVSAIRRCPFFVFCLFFFLQYRISLNTFCIPRQRPLCLTRCFFSEAFQRSFLPKNLRCWRKFFHTGEAKCITMASLGLHPAKHISHYQTAGE